MVLRQKFGRLVVDNNMATFAMSGEPEGVGTPADLWVKATEPGFAENNIVSGQVHEVAISLEGKGVLVKAEIDSETGVQGTAECWEPSHGRQ